MKSTMTSTIRTSQVLAISHSARHSVIIVDNDGETAIERNGYTIKVTDIGVHLCEKNGVGLAHIRFDLLPLDTLPLSRAAFALSQAVQQVNSDLRRFPAFSEENKLLEAARMALDQARTYISQAASRSHPNPN